MKEEIIEIKKIPVKTATLLIQGDSDLVLNKMNDPTIRELIDIKNGKGKNLEKPNYWEEVITSIHWYNGKPTDFSEEGLRDALANNAPCISAFGLRKSFGDAVVRNEIDNYSTKFFANVHILAKGDLIPIKFAEHHIDEKLISPKKNVLVLSKTNRFTGWSAEFTIRYLENVYSLEQIVNIINLAGFGLGIGSGRKGNGYGRYHVADIK